MFDLILEWVHEGRVQKKFRMTQARTGASLGSSRHADFRLSSQWVRPIEGLFEYRMGEWFYISLQPDRARSEMILKEGETVKIGETHFRICYQSTDRKLFQGLFAEVEGETQKVHLFAVFFHGKLMRTAVLSEGQSFTLETASGQHTLQPHPETNWKSTQFESIEVRSSTQLIAAHHDWLEVERKELTKKDKINLAAALSFVFALSMTLILAPKRTQMVDIAPPKQVAYQEVKLPDVKKREVVKKEIKEVAPSKKLAGGNSSTASVTNQLRNIGLNRLIAKVSARGPASANLVISQGQQASSDKPTGRALAAIGSLQGKNWEGAITGSKGVSTVGRGGGSDGYKSMGSLNAGNTGKAGVGLIEEESDVAGGLDREIIAQYIRSQLGQILYCYERQLSARPDLFGKVAIKFTIGPSGEVETQKIGETSLRDTSVEGCILQKVARWKFPAPEGGTRVLVTYPFLFKSTN